MGGYSRSSQCLVKSKQHEEEEEEDEEDKVEKKGVAAGAGMGRDPMRDGDRW